MDQDKFRANTTKNKTKKGDYVHSCAYRCYEDNQVYFVAKKKTTRHPEASSVSLINTVRFQTSPQIKTPGYKHP